jgi:hypothetical protein
MWVFPSSWTKRNVTTTDIRNLIVTYAHKGDVKGVHWYGGALYNMKIGTNDDFELIEKIKVAIETKTTMPSELHRILEQSTITPSKYIRRDSKKSWDHVLDKTSDFGYW